MPQSCQRKRFDRSEGRVRGSMYAPEPFVVPAQAARHLTWQDQALRPQSPCVIGKSDETPPSSSRTIILLSRRRL